MSTRYALSERQLDRARKTIPLGAQTFSKSITQYPLGVSPYFADRAKGSRLWDVDGNEYIDYISALGAINLGYCDPDVDAAVHAQIDRGTVFSLSHTIESEVAEMVCSMVPSAEMARFGKNGSDATAAAVRTARAYTGREHIIACGYHGWQDWYIGATSRNKGVPTEVRALTHVIPYNDVAALQAKLDELEGKVAAIILEPMSTVFPSEGYLPAVRAAATKAGVVLIFDEVITGFRWSKGGAQELFGVTPDLTTLGKAIANGYPLSVICGKRELMMELEEVFFSGTMGGEAASLAAALATMTKLQREPVIQTIKERGEYLTRELNARIDKYDADYLKLTGHPAWTYLSVSDKPGATQHEIKTLWLQEMFDRGILSLGTHNLTYAHSAEDIDRLLAVYDEVLPFITSAVKNNAVRQYLRCDPLIPLFKVR